MAYGNIRHRLREGRPLVLDCDVAAALRQRGHVVDSPGALGALLHTSPEAVLDHHRIELSAKVDVLSALTADTTPRSLSEGGMEHRSARLTGRALDLAHQAVSEGSRSVAIAGVLGSDHVTATKRVRFEDETKEHIARVAVAGAELVVIRSAGSRVELVFSTIAAARAEMPSFVVIEEAMVNAEELTELVPAVADAGAEAILFEVSSVDEGLGRLDVARAVRPDIPFGALLSAVPNALRGFPSPLFESWVDRSVELSDAGARIVGGGAGTTEEHTRALLVRLGVLHPSLPPAL